MKGFPHQTANAIALAPMDGLTDEPARRLIASYGGVSYCTTEFVRVSANPVTEKVLLRECPELLNGGRTPDGVPVALQILGGDPALMAASAKLAAGLGALAIDINFGCPAKCVNRHDGGSAILRFPDRLYGIVAAVRDAVPENISVSAKIRLGFTDPDDVYTNATTIERAGPTWITLHARTREQGYKPYADWERIRIVHEMLRVPLVANGDIFTPADVSRCREKTGCSAVMVGRGAIKDPFFFVRAACELPPCSGARFMIDLARAYLSRSDAPAPAQIAARLKHWGREILPPDGFGEFKHITELETALKWLERFDPVPEAA